MKKSQVERAVEKVQAEIDMLEAVKARLIAVQARAPIKERKRRILKAAPVAVPQSA